jgi:hypothetical protein
MSTNTTSQLMADLEAISASVAAKTPVDPVVARRIQEQSAEIRKKLPQTNIAVELIREARNQ